MDDLERFNKFAEALRFKCPKLKIVYKTESKLMKLFGLFMFFAPKFNKLYTTTIGSTVYLPSEEFIKQNPLARIEALAHEYKHISDTQKYTNILFLIAYLFPQILFLLIIPLWFLIGWYSLFCLIFLAPLPAYFRTRLEVSAYKVSLFTGSCLMRELGVEPDEMYKNLSSFAERISKNAFKGPVYYFMWPFGVENELKATIEMIRSGTIYDTDKIYSDIEEVLELSKSL